MCNATHRCCPLRQTDRKNPADSGIGPVSRSSRRYARTILIGTFALAALVWMAVDQFGVSRQEMLELMLVTGLVVLLVIAFAGTATLIWVGLRKLLRGGGGE